jgi:peptidoglycan hydrolase CwlO-like protein
MDVEILVHGVPDGQKYYGTKDEQTNMGLFYDNSQESVKFVVETKKQGSTAFVYYSYLRYKGMIEAGGRLGGYFGLTLRLDKYYQDAIHIYNLLEMVFKRYIVGSLLTPLGDGYKYTIPDFASKASEIAQMQQMLIQLIQTTCSPNKFLDIDASFIHPISAAPRANITDVSDAAILASIKKYSKVVLSPDYELNIEKEYKKKIQEADGKGGNIIAEKDKKIAEKDSSIASLNTKVASQQNKIAVLEQESKRKDTEIQQLKQKGDLAQQVAKIKDPIMAIAEFFRIKNPTPKEPSYGRKNYFIGILCCGLSVIIFALCVFSLLRDPSSTPNDNKIVDRLEAQVGSLNKEIQRLTGIIREKNDTIDDLRTKINPTPRPVTAEQLKIDVNGKDIAGEKFIVGKTMSTSQQYTIKILKKAGGSISNNTGKWKLTNATLKSGKLTDTQITIQPKDAGEVKFEYIPNDLTKFASMSRSEQAKVPEGTKPINFSLLLYPNDDQVIAGKTYTINVSGYEGDVDTWRFSGCDGDKNSKLSAEIKIKVDATDIAVTFVPQGMQLEDAQKCTLKKKVKQPE